MSKPKLIVFDLDYTLWPFWVDTHYTPPFRQSGNDIVDSDGQKIKYYPDVPRILDKLHSDGYILGVASRTSEIRGANQLIQLFGWDRYFTFIEIYPGCKQAHFKNFRKNSKLDYGEMLFFDDEQRNIIDVGKLGVKSILVNHGVNEAIVREGLQRFAASSANRS